MQPRPRSSPTVARTAFAHLAILALAFPAAAPGQVLTNPYTFTTFAGLAQNTGATNGTGTAARFGSPYGIAVGPTGNIYVGDPAEETVRMITSARVVTTLAGTAQSNGSANGLGTAATFNGVSGIALDSSGNLYVADTNNDLIRKIAPDTTVTTYAGTAGSAGSTDGTGVAAKFNLPSDLAVDGSGNLYVADTGNNTIRRIAPGGIVTTFAGTAGAGGSSDGTGAAASFLGPRGVAVDPSGNVYVADTRNFTIRVITPARVVTTLAGVAGSFGSTDGVGASARFGSFFGGPFGLALDKSGNIYVSDTGNETIRMIAAGGVVTTIAGTPGAYGSLDATGASASFNTPVGIGVDSSGAVYLADFDNSTVRRGATAIAGYLIDLSVRASAGTGAQTLIVGFSIGGTGTSGSKPILVRGIGPTLASFGVTGVLADPQVSLLSGSTILQTNNDWGTPLAGNASVATLTATMAQVGAYALPAGSKDAVLLATVNSAPYTAEVSSATAGGTGIALAEVYDATPAAGFALTTPRLINISGRAQIGSGGTILIGGFVVGGAAPETLLIRGVGPTLASFGVAGALADPVLTLFDGNGKAIQSNTGWGGTAALTAAFLQAGAFALPALSADSAMLITVSPGNYTAEVSSASGSTGVGLVEVYELR